MSAYLDMVDRHKREIKKLQDNCMHQTISDWMPHYYAPGHSDGCVKICLDCGKILFHKHVDYITGEYKVSGETDV